MSILDELMKNARLVADSTAKKTTEVSGIAKLKVNVKLEEAKLSECYENIGRLFYTAERGGEDNTTEIASYIMEADKIKSTISGYKKELAKLKNVVICEGCGAEISNENAYCPICGTKQPVKEAPVEEPACACASEEKCECTEECTCEEKCECTEECTCEEKAECECTCEEKCECTAEETCGCTEECTCEAPEAPETTDAE